MSANDDTAPVPSPTEQDQPVEGGELPEAGPGADKVDPGPPTRSAADSESE